MATLTVQTSAMGGVAFTMGAATAGSTGAASADDFANDGRTSLLVKNSGAFNVEVTFNSATACDQGFDHDIVVDVSGTGGEKLIGPFTVARFGPSTTFWYEDVSLAGVTVAAIRVG